MLNEVFRQQATARFGYFEGYFFTLIRAHNKNKSRRPLECKCDDICALLFTTVAQFFFGRLLWLWRKLSRVCLYCTYGYLALASRK